MSKILTARPETIARVTRVGRQKGKRGARESAKGSTSHEDSIPTEQAHAIGVWGEPAVAKLFGIPWHQGGPDGGVDLVLPVTGRKVAVKTRTKPGDLFSQNLNSDQRKKSLKPDGECEIGVLCILLDAKRGKVEVWGYVEAAVWYEEREPAYNKKGDQYWVIQRRHMHPIEELLSAEGISQISRSRDNLARLYARCWDPVAKKGCGFQQLKTNKRCAFCGRVAEAQ